VTEETVMTTARLGFIGILVVALVVATASAAAAAALPRLPQDVVVPQHDGSPAQVTFSHASHVDGKKPACTGCHPALFRILRSGTPAGDPGIRHTSMEAGRQCGACHNDRAAFGLDKCELCHRGR
jgi:c(7)-type cytochrome triheme protein